jgi:lipopolysaccharide export system protein LptA
VLSRLASSFLWILFPFFFLTHPLSAQTPSLPITIEGERLHWIKENEIIRGEGRVRVSYEEGWIEADTAVVNYRTGVIEAFGHIRWNTPDTRGEAEAITVHARTLEGELFRGRIEDPQGAVIRAERIVRTGKNRYTVYNGEFTTCHCQDQRIPSWEITWSRADVRWREDIFFIHGSFFANGIPILYLPVGYSSLLGKRTPGFLLPKVGYSSRYGFLLEPGFFYPMGDHADLTMRWLFTESSGYGFSTLSQTLTPTGSLSLSTQFFQESPRAPYLSLENRGPRQRWSIAGNVVEKPFSLFRLNANLSILSDSFQQRDFASDLKLLTANSSVSNLDLSGESLGFGSAILRFSISQALLTPTSSGSRFPTLWLRMDPARFDPLPFWVSADLRFDQFFSYDAKRALPWQPPGYVREGRRLLTHMNAGGYLDFLPGVGTDLRGGIITGQRDVGLGVPVSTTIEPYFLSDTSLKLLLLNPRGSARIEPGFLFYYTPGQSPEIPFPVEDRDRISFERWFEPYLRWTAFYHSLRWSTKLSFPRSFTTTTLSSSLNDPTGPTLLRSSLIIPGGEATVMAWIESKRIPQFNGHLRFTMFPAFPATLGYARISTEVEPSLPLILGRPSPFSDDRVPLIPTHEIFLSQGFAIGRFSGAVTFRRRLGLEENPLAGWVERQIRIRYTSPCKCWFAEFSAYDFPGAIADRVEFLIELTRLGGIGIEPQSPGM